MLITNAADRPFRWVQLHAVTDASSGPENGLKEGGATTPTGDGWTEYLVGPTSRRGDGAAEAAATPACTAFRLRFLGVRDAGAAEDVVVPGLRFQVCAVPYLLHAG